MSTSNSNGVDGGRNPFYEAAKEYLRQGYNPIPLRPRSKKPAVQWQTYQTEQILPSTLEAWNYEGAWNGVAIICGSISKLVVVDCDSKEVFERVHSLAPVTKIVKSGSGKSWHLYAHTNISVEPRRINTPWGHVDIQGEGTYIVTPPTLHEKTGEPYEWKESSEPADFKDFEPVFNFLRPYMAGSKKPISQIIKGSIGSGLRNDSAIRYAGYLHHIIKLDPPTILYELQRWNQQVCSPPLNDAEINEVWRSAIRYQSSQKTPEVTVKEVKQFEP